MSTPTYLELGNVAGTLTPGQAGFGLEFVIFLFQLPTVLGSEVCTATMPGPTGLF